VTGADPGEVTALLLEWNEGKEDARERLVALVYPELRRLASRSLRSGRADQTLQPTALVHEAYQKLVDQRRVQWRNRAHFFAIASELMRRIVVGHARHRHAVRRGGNAERVPFSEELAGTALGPDVELIALDDALTELAVLDKELRATSVKGWLTHHGIDGSRLTTDGFGDTRPIEDNKTDEGRARNRRVELVKL
jgi:RNA polymerase sigma factor (TIGR02999 family)